MINTLHPFNVIAALVAATQAVQFPRLRRGGDLTAWVAGTCPAKTRVVGAIEP